MATKVKSSAKKSAKTTKKAAKPKAAKCPPKPKGPKKAKPASKSVAKRVKVQSEPKAVVARTPRRFPRGQSPFSSPVVGVTVFSEVSGLTRTVTAVDAETVTFNESGPLADHAGRVVARSSWSQWCSRMKAEFLDSQPAADPAPAEEPAAEPDAEPTPESSDTSI